MPEPLKQFIDAVDDLKVDKTILKSEIGESAQDALKDFGQDLGESVKNLLKPKDKNLLFRLPAQPQLIRNLFLSLKTRAHFTRLQTRQTNFRLLQRIPVSSAI